MKIKAAFLVVSFLALAGAIAAHADTTLLNTYTPTGNGNYASDSQQYVAVFFSSSSAVTVDSIEAAISASGSVVLGIEADSSGPSNTFLYDTTLTAPTGDVTLNNLDWTLNAGNYWLVVDGTNSALGEWGAGEVSSAVVPYAFTGNPSLSPWHIDNSGNAEYTSPEALITATDVTATPEPSSLWLLGSGLVSLAGMVRRKIGRRA